MGKIFHKAIIPNIQRNVQHREDNVSLLMPKRAEIDERMRFEVFQVLFILRQPAEHRAILHVVAMQQQVLRPFGHRMVFIEKNRARRALLSVQVTVQVIIIVLPLNHWIIDLSSRNLNPGNDVRILGIQHCEINC